MAHHESICWPMIAVDEAHRLKIKDSELHIFWLGFRLRIGC
jgi:hypothetical protein